MTASYVFGTVTVTNGSNIVTGDGTGWETALVSPGFLGTDTAGSVPVPVLRVDNDTQLTLVQPWRGTTQSGVSYWLSYDTRDGQQTVNNHILLSDYLARLNSATLAALAALTPLPNTVIGFDGSGGVELKVFTELAESILALNADAATRANKSIYFDNAGVAQLYALTQAARDFLSKGTTAELRAQLNAVSKAGDTMTGGLSITSGGLTSQGTVRTGGDAIIDTAGTSPGNLGFFADNNANWIIQREAQGAAGRPLHVVALNDSGVFLRNVMTFSRDGSIRTADQPAMRCYLNAGSATFATGQQSGIVNPDAGGFVLNRGGFYQGGGVISGSYAVHVPQTGAYLICFKAFFLNSSGNHRMALQINAAGAICTVKSGSGDGSGQIASASVVINLTRGDYINMVAPTGNPQIFLGLDLTEVSATYLG